MVDPISNTTMAPTYSYKNRGDSAGPTAAPVSVDKVNISLEGLEAQKFSPFSTGEEDAAKARKSPWMLPTMGTHSERTLKNGHTEIMKIEDGKLTVREYDGDRLVKSVDGTIVEGQAVLDTTYYDKSGKATQTIHSELTRLEEKNGWSGASMTRSVTWFEDGRTVRTLSDEMILRTHNEGAEGMKVGGNEFSRMTNKIDGDSDKLLQSLTHEDHNLSYHADIQEFYDNKQLSRSVVIDQSGEFKQESNRNEEKVGDMEGMTTRELHHDAELTLVINDYDRDGRLLREATVSDQQEDGVGSEDGKQYQTADITWYKDGKKVKHGNGSFQLKETATHQLAKRPGVLDLLGLTAEEYLTPEAKDADYLLGTNLAESSAAAEFFLEGTARGAAKGQYGSASHMAEYGKLEQPFDVDWTTELYEEGEMVMRKQDSQHARSSTGLSEDDRLPFRLAGALSDGDRPAVLKRSEHTTEIFENGKTVAMESQKTREFLQPDDHGPDTLMTLADYDRLDETDGEDGLNVVYKGDIDAADPDSRAALRAMGTEIDQTMDDFYETYRNVRGPYVPYGKASSFWFKGFDE